MADSITIFNAILALAAGAIVAYLARITALPLVDAATVYSSNHAAATGSAWLRTGVEWLPVIFLLLTLFGVVTVSVYNRPGGA